MALYRAEREVIIAQIPSELPLGGIRTGFERLAWMLFDIVGSRVLFQNVKMVSYRSFAEAFLRVA